MSRTASRHIGAGNSEDSMIYGIFLVVIRPPHSVWSPLMDVISDRAVVPRHCVKCDGLARLHIRHRTPRANMRIWSCPLCGWQNTIIGRWRYMRVERIERRQMSRPAPGGERLEAVECMTCRLPVTVGYHPDRPDDVPADPAWPCPSCGTNNAMTGAREVLYAHVRRPH